jgi:hypothetical protein
MANYDFPADLIADTLFRMDEPATDSDFLSAVRRALIRANHDLSSRHPWWWLRSYPPGAFNTTDDITTLTITATTVGTGVTATLSASQSASLVGRKILPSGQSWFARVTAHANPSATVTLDSVPTSLAAGTAITIVQDEYQLAADLGLFVDGLWTEDGYFVELQPEERIRKDYGDKPSPSWPPTAFCRLDPRRIRLSHYPNAVKRVEYPYCTMPDDLDPTDGSTTEVTVPHAWRWLLADATLYFAYLMKSDKRAPGAKQDYERGIEEAVSYHRRIMMGIGSNPGSGVRSPYL